MLQQHATTLPQQNRFETTFHTWCLKVVLVFPTIGGTKGYPANRLHIRYISGGPWGSIGLRCCYHCFCYRYCCCCCCFCFAGRHVRHPMGLLVWVLFESSVKKFKHTTPPGAHACPAAPPETTRCHKLGLGHGGVLAGSRCCSAHFANP